MTTTFLPRHPDLRADHPCHPGWEPPKGVEGPACCPTRPTRSTCLGEESPDRAQGPSFTGALASWGLQSLSCAAAPHTGHEQNGGSPGCRMQGADSPTVLKGVGGERLALGDRERVFTWLGKAWLKFKFSCLNYTKRDRDAFCSYVATPNLPGTGRDRLLRVWDLSTPGRSTTPSPGLALSSHQTSFRWCAWIPIPACPAEMRDEERGDRETERGRTRGKRNGRGRGGSTGEGSRRELDGALEVGQVSLCPGPEGGNCTGLASVYHPEPVS